MSAISSGMMIAKMPHAISAVFLLGFSLYIKNITSPVNTNDECHRHAIIKHRIPVFLLLKLMNW